MTLFGCYPHEIERKTLRVEIMFSSTDGSVSSFSCSCPIVQKPCVRIKIYSYTSIFCILTYHTKLDNRLRIYHLHATTLSTVIWNGVFSLDFSSPRENKTLSHCCWAGRRSRFGFESGPRGHTCFVINPKRSCCYWSRSLRLVSLYVRVCACVVWVLVMS